MYLYQPCLLTMALHAWSFEQTEGKVRWLRILFPLGVLAISEWELTFTGISIYPSAVLLPVLFLLGRCRAVAWPEVLAAALLGGLLCWKTADAWPLLPGLMVLCGALLMISILLLCCEWEDRRLACALGGLVFELFFCLREYMLFSFCVLRFGSRQSLELSTTAICVYAVFETLRLAVGHKGKGAASAGK